jgi:hypothetical protein
MTSVSHQTVNSTAFFGSHVFNLTGLDPSDLVIIVGGSSGNHNMAVAGGGGAMGSMFHKWTLANGGGDVMLWDGVGMSGSVALTVSWGSTFDIRLDLLRVSGLNDPGAAPAYAVSTWFAVDGVATGLQTATDAETVGPLSFGAGQLALFLGAYAGTTGTLQYAGDPDTWTTVRADLGNGAQHITRYAIGQAGDSTAEQTQSNTDIGGQNQGCALLVYGTPDAPPEPPAPAGVTGWGRQL